jgi:hypothetical protein
MKFIEIVKKLNRKGDAFIKKNGSAHFHHYAAEILHASDVWKEYNFQDVAAAVFDKHTHNFPNLEFSDLPVTLARGEKSFIDVYFWRRRPTMIHNHHFNGAFLCLEGHNVDLEFHFKKEKKLGKYHDLGTLDLVHTRPIAPGIVAPIAALDKFIHQNHHQSDLTVNLCFRTPEFSKKHISSYLYSGLRSEKNPEMMARVHRLRRLIDMGDFDIKKLKISDDDALYFLVSYYDSRLQNKRLVDLLTHLNGRIKKNLGIHLPKLLVKHDLQLEKLENEYE